MELTTTATVGGLIDPPKSVSVYDTQPVVEEGVRSLLGNTQDLLFQLSCNSVEQAQGLLKTGGTDILLLDKTLGSRQILDLLSARLSQTRPAVVVWGAHLTDPEASRFLMAGASGVLLRSAGPKALLSCLRAVAAGETWIQPNITSEESAEPVRQAPTLTLREQKILDLAGRGLQNREIASNLGITLSTVKIYMKRIFAKTGATSRDSSILNDLRKQYRQ